MFKSTINAFSNSISGILLVVAFIKETIKKKQTINTLKINYDNYDLRNIKVPVLIIHSEDDKLANPEKARYWSNEIPGCTSVFFSGGGHLMSGNSEEIDHVLDEFVEENK